VAAATYRIREVRAYGLVLWDSGWYGGNLPLGYSVVFPLVGALIGLVATGIVGAFTATWAFDRLTAAAWGRRSIGTWYFAVTTILQVAIGQLPFLTAEAIGLLALVALNRRHTVVALSLAALCALCSPLAAAFLAMACLAWALGHADRRVATLSVAAGAGIMILLLGVNFPGSGAFPFPWAGLVLSLALCAAVFLPMVPPSPTIRWGAAIYAVSSVASFLIPNPLGGNAPRFAGAIGIPILVCLVASSFRRAPGSGLSGLSGQAGIRSRPTFRSRPRFRSPSKAGAPSTLPKVGRGSVRAVLLATVVVGLGVWEWAPGLNALASPTVRAASDASFYRPVLNQILSRSTGPVRVEAVPTQDHWESVYLAPQLSLARGWERQLDVADNPLFYTPGALSDASYLTWLHRNGVTWVALPNTPLDYAAKDEATLLERGVPGLQLAWSSAQWRLWRVPGSPGLVTGPGHLERLDPDHLTLRVERAATVTVRVRYTRYWAPDAGSDACVSPGPDGWTDVTTTHPGPVELSISLLNRQSTRCASR
jgi:hypothetical protein